MICRFSFVLCSKFLIRLNPHSFLSAEKMLWMKALAFSCQVLHHLLSKLAVLFYQQWALDECPISAIWNSLFEIRSVSGNFPEPMCSRALDAAWDSTLCANVLVSRWEQVNMLMFICCSTYVMWWKITSVIAQIAGLKGYLGAPCIG